MEINEIAGKHLGSKQGDYSTYQDISEVRSDFLVGVPRALNRENLKTETYNGQDVWRGYEVSALTDNGFPVNFIAQITFDAQSKNLVESKSMKLYWNSFNMTKMGETFDSVKQNITTRATQDLSACAGSAVSVVLADPGQPAAALMLPQPYEDMARGLLNEWKDIKSYTDDPSVLQDRETSNMFVFRSTSLRSNCRITKQPDFGDIVIKMMPNSMAPTSLSMLRYIISLRNEAHFHEEIVELVFDTLWERYKPKTLTVEAFYTRRGGWDINPYRSSESENKDVYSSTLITHAPDFSFNEAEIKRTARQ